MDQKILLAVAFGLIAQTGGQLCSAAEAVGNAVEPSKFDRMKLAQNSASKPAAKTVAAVGPATGAPAAVKPAGGATAVTPATTPADKPAADATKPADKVVKEDKDPGYIAAFNKGVELFNKSKYQEAADEFLKAIEINQFNVGCRNWLAITYQRMNKHKEAAEVLEKVVDMDPDYADYHNNLGFSYQMLEDYEKADFEYRRALELKPGLEETKYNLAYILQFEKEREGATAESIKLFEEILKGKPSQERQLEVYLRIGDMAKDSGDTAKALEYYKKALALNAKDPNVKCKLALLEPDKSKRKEALEGVLDLDPANYAAHLNLGIIAYEEKDFTTALAKLGEALKRNPYDAAVHYWLGRYYYSLDAAKSAIKQFEDAIKCDQVEHKFPDLEEWLKKAKDKQANF